jgi:hypothetical protein
VEGRDCDAAGLDAPVLLTPGWVARLFGVDAKTVTRSARGGRLPSLKTLGVTAATRSARSERSLAQTSGFARTSCTESVDGVAIFLSVGQCRVTDWRRRLPNVKPRPIDPPSTSGAPVSTAAGSRSSFTGVLTTPWIAT